MYMSGMEFQFPPSPANSSWKWDSASYHFIASKCGCKLSSQLGLQDPEQGEVEY